MWIAERFLWQLAKMQYKSQLAHSQEMKEALSSQDKYDQYRFSQMPHINEVAKRYGIEIHGKTVVDFGCGDGAISASYIYAGARQVIGIDIDAAAIQRARELYAS